MFCPCPDLLHPALALHADKAGAAHKNDFPHGEFPQMSAVYRITAKTPAATGQGHLAFELRVLQQSIAVVAHSRREVIASVTPGRLHARSILRKRLKIFGAVQSPFSNQDREMVFFRPAAQRCLAQLFIERCEQRSGGAGTRKQALRRDLKSRMRRLQFRN